MFTIYLFNSWYVHYIPIPLLVCSLEPLTNRAASKPDRPYRSQVQATSVLFSTIGHKIQKTKRRAVTTKLISNSAQAYVELN
jgi:hypothetical protein